MVEEVINGNDNIINNSPIPIRALRSKVRNRISTLLNPEKYIPSKNGLQRDWHGLAELCRIGGEKIPNLQQSNDPSNRVLDFWIEHNKDESTIDKLLSFFEELDRFDIIYEIAPLIEEDIEFFKQNTNGCRVDYTYIDDRNILTVDDIDRKNKGLCPQTYDAFVLFADDDIVFATELIEKMEKEYNIKLCVKDRDLVGGAIEHNSLIQLISKRCGRVVAIISPAFFESPVHKYLYGLAQIEGIEQRTRKIIPCLIKPCDNLPPDFKIYHILNYMNAGKLYDFWDRLYHSIKYVQTPCIAPINEVLKRSMETLELNNLVKFRSMGNLRDVENSNNTSLSKSQDVAPKEEVPRPPDSNELTEVGWKKNNSLYKKIKNMLKTVKNPNQVPENDRAPASNLVRKESKKKFWKNIKAKVAVAS